MIGPEIQIPTSHEMGEKCLEAGYGDFDEETATYESLGFGPIIINGYVMPTWMAEVLAKVANKRREEQ